MVSQVDRSALFQLPGGVESVPEPQRPKAEDEQPAPVPPFPFPSIAFVWEGHVTVVHSPELDTGVGSLEFEVVSYNDANGTLDTARCLVSPGSDGKPLVSGRVTGGLWKGKYWDEAVSTFDQARESLDRTHAFNLRKIRDMEVSGDNAERAAEWRQRHAALTDRIRELRAREEAADESYRSTAKGLIEAIFTFVIDAVEWINTPEQFIVRIASEVPSRKLKTSRVRRLHERPRHILLDKNAIKTRWQAAQEDTGRAAPMPHLRRGHYRTLSAERYAEKRGKRIWVRATHVAGQCVEWRQDGVSYTVL